MTERPILFSAPMVLALREGRKTQTRRTRGLGEINTKPDRWILVNDCGHSGADGMFKFSDRLAQYEDLRIRCPYGVEGDQLWTRETWGLAGARLDDPCLNFKAGGQSPINRGEKASCGLWFPSHAPALAITTEELMRPSLLKTGWRPSIHMPRWASRDTLEVISARPERLQDITKADALAEGIQVLPLQSADDPSAWYQSAPGVHQCRTAVDSYRQLWDSINGPGSWAHNDWVWRVAFKRLEAR